MFFSKKSDKNEEKTATKVFMCLGSGIVSTDCIEKIYIKYVDAVFTRDKDGNEKLVLNRFAYLCIRLKNQEEKDLYFGAYHDVYLVYKQLIEKLNINVIEVL